MAAESATHTPATPEACGPGRARHVWVPGLPARRNIFARFRRVLRACGSDLRGTMHVFADTRYVARVNGHFAGSGPARFANSHPEFDTWDIGRFLVEGENQIEILVNFFGASSYQTEPGGRPALIVWGDAAGEPLETPGAWECLEETAWRGDSPLFSFAQGPVEICDTRELGDGGWRPVEELQDGPWGQLRAFSGTPWTPERVSPSRIVLAGGLKDTGERLCAMSHDPALVDGRRVQERRWRMFGLWVRSPVAAHVVADCFWTDLECNGEPVKVETRAERGNHGEAVLPLREGWNFLCGRFEVLAEYWAFCLGFPRADSLELRAAPDADAPRGLWLSPLLEKERASLPRPEDAWPPAGWAFEDGDPPNYTPARAMAWDVVGADAARDIEPARLPEVSWQDGAGATWVFSFEGEFLGHIELDVEGPDGTVLDVATDDWRRESGMTALYRSNPFTDSADRFVLSGSRQRIMLFHPRGGKYLQVTMRPPGGSGRVALHDASVISRRCLHDAGARFASDLAALDWAWDAAMRTVFCSTDDGYSDSPWRERASYIGDLLAEMHQHFVMHPDWRMVRRTLGLFAHTALPDGQLSACAPSWLRMPHGDFSLLWIVALYDYWAHSGDAKFVREMLPAALAVWRSPSWKRGPEGLLDENGNRLFIDWGVRKSDRTGRGNAVLNVLRGGAGRALARLAEALGENVLRGDLLAEAAATEDLLLRHLWAEDEGRLRPSLDDDGPALHANVFALAFGIGDESRRKRILAFLDPHLRDNLRRGLEADERCGHLELYFFHYLLPALAAHGRPDLAEMLVQSHYGFLAELGDDTLPECFSRVSRGVGSRCHPWSGAAATYAARHVAGIRLREAGRPEHLVFDPVVAGVSRASARIAHPRGIIEVAWHKDAAGRIVPDLLTAPEGVEIRDAAGTVTTSIFR